MQQINSVFLCKWNVWGILPIYMKILLSRSQLLLRVIFFRMYLDSCNNCSPILISYADDPLNSFTVFKLSHSSFQQTNSPRISSHHMHMVPKSNATPIIKQVISLQTMKTIRKGEAHCLLLCLLIFVNELTSFLQVVWRKIHYILL